MSEHKTFFEENGYLILPKYFGGRSIEGALTKTNALIRRRPVDVVVDFFDTGERTVVALVPPFEMKARLAKVVDLYLHIPEVRALALEKGLVTILRDLLGHVPVLCNSLYFEKGSAQPPHSDILFMTPRTPGHLIVIWVALEDIKEDAGPLEYYPGSHLIQPMIFSNGGTQRVSEEAPQWQAYIENCITKAGLKKQSFLAKKGDVFIWHANLLHGGGAIGDLSLTRKSAVFHFLSEVDCRQTDLALVGQAGGYWIERPNPVTREIIAKLPFSEAGYLSRYPDVAALVHAGMFNSGKGHFDVLGWQEGRLPC
jgi:ectoine hydroxylase-related dioxygenase (phytanoyl-CoA dioxygenase family)